jgi:NAD-dependent SIR2 family protein deacetylase
MLAKELFPGQYAPTPAHHMIKVLADRGWLLRCYTQNIDGLERVAGIDPGMRACARNFLKMAIRAHLLYVCACARTQSTLVSIFISITSVLFIPI